MVMELLARLGAEHIRILSVADAFDVFASEIETTQTVDTLETIRFVTFFRGYVDGMHHEREESVLFPGLVDAGFSLDFGPLTHIMDQHRQQGRLLLSFEKNISRKPPWEAPERAAIVEAIRALTAFQREHIGKERDMLLPEAVKDLAPHKEAIDAREARFDRVRMPRWDAAWLEALGAELVLAHPRGA